jgi:putative nucleotidyltransferase with HDIG domain
VVSLLPRLRRKRVNILPADQSLPIRKGDVATRGQSGTLAEVDALLSDRTLGAMEGLLAAIDARDTSTADHARRARRLALAIGRKLGLTQGELDQLGHAALFHDVGKLAIADAVLLKAGDLSASEWHLIHNHPDDGARIIEGLGFPSATVAAMRHHHERFDGTGYPEGLAGEEIPLGARIIHVADAWDSMLAVRSYRPALSEREALRELQRGVGTQFCPRCVEAIEAVLPAMDAPPPASLSVAS